MAHTWRRAALYNKRYATANALFGRVASGNLLVADNDEPEADACPPAPAPRPLTSGESRDPLLPSAIESATEYAQRRARENDQRAFDVQINGSGSLPW